MRESTLARGIATLVCGLVFCVAVVAWAKAQSFGLADGQLDVVYNDDKSPVAHFKGKKIPLGYGHATHSETFTLSDRQIVIFETLGDVRGMPPQYSILSVGPRGAFRDVSGRKFYTADGTFLAMQKGDVIEFNLGYADGLKKTAVLSSKGMKVSLTKVTRPQIPEQNCKELQEVLSECAMKSSCDQPMDLSMATWRVLSRLENNPRWKVGGSRFHGLCTKACETQQTPNYANVATDVCGRVNAKSN
jgi:hypothetical protein